jgi:heme/copper-type cytochrome/quinol oxidase subunit 1
MLEYVFRKMPQQYLIAGTFFLILGVWVRHLASADGVSPAGADFFHASHGTLMVFFGIIPIFFVAVGYGLVPSTGVTAWPFWDRFALVVFYLSAGAVVITLSVRSHILLDFALGLNFIFGIAAAVGFIVRSFFAQNGRGNGRLRATAVAFLGLSLWIIITYTPLEFAAIMQFTGTWLVGSSPSYNEVAPNDEAVPLVWKHLFWFLGHPEVIVFFTLIGGLIADGVRNLFWRRAAV